MRYRYLDDFRRGISVFAIFSYGIAVLGTPQSPPPKTPSWWYPSGKNDRLAARSEERSPWPFSKRKRSVKAAPSSLRKRLRISFSSGRTESLVNVPLWPGPLYEQPLGCSRTVPRDLLHHHPEPNI